MPDAVAKPKLQAMDVLDVCYDAAMGSATNADASVAFISTDDNVFSIHAYATNISAMGPDATKAII